MTKYTKAQRDADTLAMIRDINANADRKAMEAALYARMENEARKRRSRRTDWGFLTAGVFLLAAACGAMWVQGERILAAYGG